nr:PREDICTED: ribonuclease CL2-like [Pelecanus crispus]
MVLVLAALSGAACQSRYGKFLRQHVDYPPTSTLPPHRYCEIMLVRRQVTVQGQPCKNFNSFVHAPAAQLVAACSQTPDAAGFYSTPNTMNITACRLRTRNSWPPCNYRAQQLQHHVRVACINGLPVHLQNTYP